MNGLSDSNKLDDYVRQKSKSGYGNVSYEKEAVMEALWMAKKLGLQYKDLNKSLKRHCWDILKTQCGISGDIERLKEIKNADLESMKQKQLENRIAGKINVVFGLSCTSYVQAMKYLKNYFENNEVHPGAEDIINRMINIWDEKSKQHKFV